MTLSLALLVVVALFPVSEIALAVFKRSHPASSATEDRGSMRALWSAITLGVVLAIACGWVTSARVHAPVHIMRLLALVLILAGLAVRWLAILTLGRFFTVDVAIQTDHRVVQAGPYRFVRHPSYSGLLLAFLGLGVFFGNWLSLVVLLVPITLAVVNRVVKEERLLLAALGASYAEYCAHTKRFIPGIL
jgi:protein-S-isoprenylcysteine O-methyltransferase